MREFHLSVGDEYARIEVPDEVSLAHLLDLLVSKGCKIKEPHPPERTMFRSVLPNSPEHVQMGLPYGEWFRRYVSDW